MRPKIGRRRQEPDTTHQALPAGGAGAGDAAPARRFIEASIGELEAETPESPGL
jgi:hypothetical protein